MTGGEDEPFEPKGTQPDVIDATGSAHKVEAVAGSGKTTTMVKRLEKEIRQGTAPNRLLVLTFANEAAHTIQEKLREVLGPQEAFDIDVYTYHSFGYQLLSEYAYQIGVSPEFELITDEQRPQLIESVYDAVDFSFVAPGSPSAGGASEHTLADLTSFIKSMRRESVTPAEIRATLPRDEQLRELLGLVNSLREMAHDVVNIDANDLMWDGTALADRCDRLAIVYRSKSDMVDGSGRVQTVVADHLQAMSETAADLADSLRTSDDPDWYTYRLPEAFFENEHNTIATVTQTPMGRLANFVDMLRRARAFVGAYEAYIEALDARDAFDYDELIHRTVSLLRNEDVRGDILSEWDAVYCDEFQDTDESQLQLVDALREGLSIMVVGDSDQAIHEWRGQDPENMSKLPASFDAIDLELNFRSRQPILDLATNLDPDKGTIEAEKEPAPPNIFKINSERSPTPEQVSTTISHLLTGRFDDVPEHDLGDIAVLVRRNANARAIADQLDQDSIPYAVSSETTSELSQGLETVVSYFRILVSPEDDVSWHRILLQLYRVPESDIDTLLGAGETVPDGYEAVEDDALSAPDRVAEAVTDYETLTGVATTHSISELYAHFKRTTRIEWFLREADRESLHNIERLIASFTDSPVQSKLTAESVAYLERQAHLLSADDETATSLGSQSEAAVDIMTIHQAKGLDFETVLLPFLTESEFGHITLDNYQQNLYSYDMLVDEIEDGPVDPLRADCSDDQIAEEWRILHVALTRAKERLFLFGNSVSDDGPAVEMIDRHLPGPESETPIEWSAAGPQMRIWNQLMESYDAVDAEHSDAVRDYTDVVARGVDEDPGTITYYQTEVTTERALETLLTFADQAVAGTLATDDTDRTDFAAAPLGQEIDIELARQHSHTSLESVRQCERAHVLDHVLGAFPDPRTADSPGGRQATIGTLFHDVAELAYWRGYEDAAEWKEACRWLARRNDYTHALKPALACIDRYFETEAASWPSIGAEIPIEDIAFTGVDGTVTGFIDTVRVHPDGGLAVLDYKTSHTQNTREESHQLQLYVQACQDRFAEPVTHAGYVYVGTAGPDTQLFDVTELAPLQETLLETLQTADESSFEQTTPGSHCQYCAHRSLGCAPETLDDDGFSCGDNDFQ